MDVQEVNKLFDNLEKSIEAMGAKADEQMKLTGTVSAETKTALENLGHEQKELAIRVRELEQKQDTMGGSDPIVETAGQMFVKSDAYKRFSEGGASKVRVEVKNTLTGSDTNVAPDRKPGVVGGAFVPMTLESLIPSLPTSSNAIEFTKEASYTNNAAEAAEAAEKAESALTWSLVNMPVSTVAHWIKISRQLASDNSALAAYVDTRMRYGVDLRVEQQLGAGNGTAPNISGILDTGNFTAHGLADAALGSVLKKLVLIRKVMATLWAGGYPADSIILNPADWATIEIDLFTATANAVRVNLNAAGQPTLFGVPVYQSIGITADTVVVAALRQAATIHNREGMVVEMSDSDDDNFTKNLITIRAERRLALTVERPAAIIAGDLTPV